MGDMQPGSSVPSKSPTVVQHTARATLHRTLHPTDDDDEVLTRLRCSLKRADGAGTKVVLEDTQVILTI
jgi:hypothetical protein